MCALYFIYLLYVFMSLCVFACPQSTALSEAVSRSMLHKYSSQIRPCRPCCVSLPSRLIYARHIINVIIIRPLWKLICCPVIINQATYIIYVFSRICCYSYFLQFSPNQILASLPLGPSIPQTTINVKKFGINEIIFMNISTILDKLNQEKKNTLQIMLTVR